MSVSRHEDLQPPARGKSRRIPLISGALLILVMTFAFQRKDLPKADASDAGEAHQLRQVAEPFDGSWSGGFPLTEVAHLIGAPDPDRMVGRRVELDRATVERVFDDRSFTVGSGAGGEVLVIPARPLMSQTVDSRNGVQAGQSVSLFGEVKRWSGIGSMLYIEAHVLEVDAVHDSTTSRPPI